jgi:hypothetical protein
MNKDIVSHLRDIIFFRDTLCSISHVDEVEIMKIWARWIITHRSLFPQHTICLPEDHEYDPQLLVELIEKGVSTLHSNFLHDWMIKETQLINRRFPWRYGELEYGGLHGNVPVTMSDSVEDGQVVLTCDDLETVLPVTVFSKLLKRAKENEATRLKPLNYIWFIGLLYSLLDGKGLQWAVPSSVMYILRNRLNCDTELFASPINQFFARYYSLFPYDIALGSRGNFFTAPDSDFISGCFQVNPPFIDCLFTKTTTRILNLLKIADDNEQDLTFVYIMPCWERFTTYEMVTESPYCVKQINLKANGHFYYQHITNTYIRARFGTCVIFLSTNPMCCDAKTEMDIIGAFSRSTPTYYAASNRGKKMILLQY